MNKGLLNKKFPTLIGIVLLVVMITIGVFLVGNFSLFNPSNLKPQGLVPTKITISNVQDNEFTVSWFTSIKTKGSIKYGDSPNNIKLTDQDERDQRVGEVNEYKLHYVTVKNLQPSKTYYFKIGLNNSLFDNNGQPYSITTGLTLESAGEARIVSGRVLNQDNTPAQGVITYISSTNIAPISAITDKEGRWAIFLNKSRSNDLSSWAIFDPEATILKIDVQGDEQNVSALAITKNAFPVPDMILGHEQYNFRDKPMAEQESPAQAKTSTPSATPKPSANLPLQAVQEPAASAKTATISGQFPLEPIVSPKQSIQVTIENPAKDGEKINALRPEFRGFGPKNKVLNVKIESPKTYSSSVTVDNQGSWKYTPPADLTPGNHNVTVTYTDENGDAKTLSKNFIVLASGTSTTPAITATSSANLISPSPATRVTIPSTESGVPKTGIVEPTLVILVISSLLILFGILTKLLFNR